MYTGYVACMCVKSLSVSMWYFKCFLYMYGTCMYINQVMFDIPMFSGWHNIFFLSKMTIDIYMAQPRDKISFYQHREHPDPYRDSIHVNPIV